MSTDIPDVRQTLEYRVGPAMMKAVPFALVLCLLGLIPLALDDHPPPKIVFSSCVLLVAGTGSILFAVFRRSHPSTPRFVLSPAGILYRVSHVREVLIPWREIEDVDTIDVFMRRWAVTYSAFAPKLRYRDVTVILVSGQFYKAHIFIGSSFRRGPAWGIYFIPNGSSVQIALHREPVSADPRALRAAVEARWRAFRDLPAGSSSPAAEDGETVRRARTSVPTVTAASRGAIGPSDAAARSSPAPGSIVVRDGQRAMSAWDTVKIVVPLIGVAVVLANLLGFWQTPGQTTAREARKEWEQDKRAWDEQQSQLQEDQRKLEESLRDAFRDF